MNNVAFILSTALAAALRTATSRTVYADDPIQLAGTLMYPYIAISDMLVQEEGPKTSFQYMANVQLEIVHRKLTSLSILHGDIDKVLSIVNNGSPFALASPFKIMDCRLDNQSTTKATKDKELFDIGIVRLFFRIE